MESYFLGEQFPLAPHFDRDDTVSNASLSLYIIFICEALCFQDKGGGGLVHFHPFSLMLGFLSCSFSSLKERSRALESGCRSDGMSSLSHISDSLRPVCPSLSPPCRSLFVGSTVSHHYRIVDNSSDKLRVSQEKTPLKIHPIYISLRHNTLLEYFHSMNVHYTPFWKI